MYIATLCILWTSEYDIAININYLQYYTMVAKSIRKHSLPVIIENTSGNPGITKNSTENPGIN